MPAQSFLSAAKHMADTAGLPWKHVQKYYRALQDRAEPGGPASEGWLPEHVWKGQLPPDSLPVSVGRAVWAANPRFEFVFADQTHVEMDPRKIEGMKAALKARINEASHTLVIVGKYADTPHPKRALIGFRNWINFEIATSRTCCNKVAAVKIDPSFESPEELITTAWAFNFDEDSIVRALDQA